MKARGDKSLLLIGKINSLIAKQTSTPNKVGKLERWGIWFTIFGTVVSAALAVVSIYLTIKISNQQTNIKDLNLVITELKKQNDATERTLSDTHTQIDTLTIIAKQLRTANYHVVDLIEEARNQSQISLTSNEPHIGIVKPVISYVNTIFNGDSSSFSDAATFNQSIVFKNYGRRDAIPKAIYVYLFKIEQSKSPNKKMENTNSRTTFSTIAKASTGSIDSTINYQVIPPGDTLGYSFSTYVLGYWNADELINDYEVVKLIYKDPLGREKEQKFYFQYDSNTSVNFAIPKSVQTVLDNLTKKPPIQSKQPFEPFIGIIRPNR